MLTKNEQSTYKTSNTDDERIRKLISRYTSNHGVTETKSDHDTDVSTFKYNAACAVTSPEMARRQDASPVPSDDCIHKIHCDSNSGHLNNDADDEINPHYENINSHLCADSSLSKPNIYRTKNGVLLQNLNRDMDQQTSVTFSGTQSPSPKPCAEKTTYCRPVQRPFDRHLARKVMERNIKLKMLLTKFVIARQKEKERENWSNYVNSLRIKHNCYRDFTTNLDLPFGPQKSSSSLQINDYYKHTNRLNSSDSCREMLDDAYATRDRVNQDYGSYKNNAPGGRYNCQHYYFSSSSLSKRALNRDLKWPGLSNTLYHSSNRGPDEVGSPEAITTLAYPPQMIVIKKSKDVQTLITSDGNENSDTYIYNEIGRQRGSTGGRHKVVMKNNNQTSTEMDYVVSKENIANVFSIQNKLEQTPNSSMEDVLSKLDKLILLFNKFVSDLKSKEVNMVSSNPKSRVKSHINEKRKSSKTSFSTATASKSKRKVTIVGNTMTNTSMSTLYLESQRVKSRHTMDTAMKLNKILYEELDKSNKLRSDIEAMLFDPSGSQPVSVQRNVDIPTRERCTEVTASLSRTRLIESRSHIIGPSDLHDRQAQRVSVGKRGSRDMLRRERRIAVNTEPLSLLELLKISTQTVLQILSFVPMVQGWCLPRRAHPRLVSGDYVCNLCGAAFPRPSLLSAHILTHDLGQTKDCAICREAVDSTRPSKLFHCQYCGKRFTRAYCCELHQQDCARMLGRTHDVPPSLAMLR